MIILSIKLKMKLDNFLVNVTYVFVAILMPVQIIGWRFFNTTV